MVKLRLKKLGRKNQPSFRLVAVEARSKRDGEVIEELGFYNPRIKEEKFTFNTERVKYWLGVGAQPTETVRYYLSKEKIVAPIKKQYSAKPGRKAAERKALAESENKESAA